MCVPVGSPIWLGNAAHSGISWSCAKPTHMTSQLKLKFGNHFFLWWCFNHVYRHLIRECMLHSHVHCCCGLSTSRYSGFRAFNPRSQTHIHILCTAIASRIWPGRCLHLRTALHILGLYTTWTPIKACKFGNCYLLRSQRVASIRVICCASDFKN